MPVEIKELQIKAVVADRRGKQAANEYVAKNEYEAIKKELVKDCIEKILQLLDDKKER